MKYNPGQIAIKAPTFSLYQFFCLAFPILCSVQVLQNCARCCMQAFLLKRPLVFVVFPARGHFRRTMSVSSIHLALESCASKKALLKQQAWHTVIYMHTARLFIFFSLGIPIVSFRQMICGERFPEWKFSMES